MDVSMKDRDTAFIESFYQAILRADRWELLAEEVPPEFATAETNEFGCVKWTPIRQPTHVIELEKIYGSIPGRMPKLFEECLMSFGWLTVELGGIDLFPHQPQSGLKVFVEHVLRDEELFPSLFRDRYVQLGKAAGGSYDPICFDLKRSKKRDCPLVRIDHESVLIDEKPVVTAELAPSFEAWLEGVRN
jgi:hypothetical protein